MAAAVAGCAHGADLHQTDAGGDDDGSGSHSCSDGQIATDVATDGTVTCASVDALVGPPIAAGCATYLGHSDGCDGCTTPPMKWGYAGATCTLGAGANDTCAEQTLGDATLKMFGLNTDGDVNDDDKLYGGLHCAVPAPMLSTAPCPAGSFVTGLIGSSWQCASIAGAAIDYVRTSCSLYLGWQDSCDGCVTPPAKWGFAGDGGCTNGAGADDTCGTFALGDEMVTLFGLNPDGDLDDNDKVHVGMHCTAPTAMTAPSSTTCPAGLFVIGTNDDGSFVCGSPAAKIHDYVAEHCSVYFGWRDSCDGCVLPPTKWGQVKDSACVLGPGLNDTCSTFTLGGVAVPMFGLNPDGDVDDDDKFFVSLHCD